MEVPACCPSCDSALVWEVELAVDRELAWAAPHAPVFPFDCPRCGARIEISFRWKLETGEAARRLRLVGGAAAAPERPAIVLVDHCPHGCGQRLGLQLLPDDPWARSTSWPDEPHVLGGYRCPRCDGEGRLQIEITVSARSC